MRKKYFPQTLTAEIQNKDFRGKIGGAASTRVRGFGWLFLNLAQKSALFISAEIQAMLSPILRKWIDVK